MANPRGKDRAREDQVQELIKRIRSATSRNPPVETIVPREAIDPKATDDDIHRLLANVVLYGTHRWLIGRVYLPDQTKLDWDGWKCRTHWKEFNGRLSHPDIDHILDEVNDCIRAATAAAIAAGALTGNLGAAVAAFKTALYSCLGGKGIGWANEIGVWIDEEEGTGDWRWCLP